jgi:hypothetical protein
MKDEQLIEQLRRENRRLAKEVYELEKKAEFLGCLEAMGVDNWCGYEEACALYSQDDR